LQWPGEGLGDASSNVAFSPTSRARSIFRMPVCSAQSIHRALLSTHEITEDEEEFADRDVTDGGQFACAPVDEGLMRIAHKQRTTLTWECTVQWTMQGLAWARGRGRQAPASYPLRTGHHCTPLFRRRAGVRSALSLLPSRATGGTWIKRRLRQLDEASIFTWQRLKKDEERVGLVNVLRSDVAIKVVSVWRLYQQVISQGDWTRLASLVAVSWQKIML